MSEELLVGGMPELTSFDTPSKTRDLQDVLVLLSSTGHIHLESLSAQLLSDAADVVCENLEASFSKAILLQLHDLVLHGVLFGVK